MQNQPMMGANEGIPTTLENQLQYVGESRARLTKAYAGIYQKLLDMGFAQPAPAAPEMSNGAVGMPGREKSMLEILQDEANSLSNLANDFGFVLNCIDKQYRPGSADKAGYN